MKKKILMVGFLLIGILVGCELNNTPTSKVEEQLSKYQMLDDDITIVYTDLATDTDIDNEYRERYEKLIREQYRNLTYEIKEEKIDGEVATVTTQIEVTDYQKIIEQYDKDRFTTEEYHKQVLEALEDAKAKVTYTIEFTVMKDEGGNWNLQPLDELERQKILGMNFSKQSYT